MSNQDLKNTNEIYDHFEKLADFIRNEATISEVEAFYEVFQPVIDALDHRKKVDALQDPNQLTLAVE